MADDSYALNDDGSPKDPKAFQQALRGDAAKMIALQEEPETLRVVLGDDMHAFQELVKGVYQVRGRQQQSLCQTVEDRQWHCNSDQAPAATLPSLCVCRQRRRGWSVPARPWRRGLLMRSALPPQCQGQLPSQAGTGMHGRCMPQDHHTDCLGCW